VKLRFIGYWLKRGKLNLLIVLNNKTISVKDGGFYSYVVTTPR
jgi:hypothetical protein